jgi:hypothetical protein
VEGVDVFVRGDTFDDALGVDVLRERELDEDAVKARVPIEARDHLEDLGF